MIEWFAAIAGLTVLIFVARAARRTEVTQRVRRLNSSRRRLPEQLRSRIASSLVRADLDLEPEDAVARLVIFASAAGVLALPMAPQIVLPVFLISLGAGPVGLRLAHDRANRRASSVIPAVLDRVSGVLRSGGTVDESIGILARGGGPIAGDMQRIRARCAMGTRLAESLASWRTGRPLPAVSAAAGAMTIADDLGGRCADALEGLASSLRQRDGAQKEALALSAQARMSAVVVGLAPLGYLLIASLADPASLRVMLTTSFGRVCLVLGLSLEVAGVLWMRAMVRAEV
ncbi:MAG: hypothetical protein EXQ69_05000 [Acidimicrobiia bacterium]|nr:hypothetical protein [Acidimicrobiia bacterium]